MNYTYIIGLHKGKKYTARQTKVFIEKALRERSKGNQVIVDWYAEKEVEGK